MTRVSHLDPSILLRHETPSRVLFEIHALSSHVDGRLCLVTQHPPAFSAELFSSLDTTTDVASNTHVMVLLPSISACSESRSRLLLFHQVRPVPPTSTNLTTLRNRRLWWDVTPYISDLHIGPTFHLYIILSNCNLTRGLSEMFST